MSRRTVVLELAGDHQLARDLVAGGVFVPELVELGEECRLVLSNEDELLELHALCVYVDPKRGSGLQLIGCDADMKHQIIALASGMSAGTGELDAIEAEADAAAPTAGAETRAAEIGDDRYATNAGDGGDDADASDAADAGDDEDATDAGDAGDTTDAGGAGDTSEAGGDGERKIALNVNERLRGLTLVQQLRIAQKGELSERIILERMYGKNVWEALLRNPRITGPEVARIARMGALPRPMLEIIVGNGAWLQIPEVRRALLTNPRLGPDQILRVLRLLPKHELKLAGTQTAYPFAVRDAAKRMLRDNAG
jgi:hypothetical protein